MIQPSIDELMHQVDSKYRLVIAAAKRARYLLDERPEMATKGKLVTIALQEIADGEIRVESRLF